MKYIKVSTDCDLTDTMLRAALAQLFAERDSPWLIVCHGSDLVRAQHAAETAFPYKLKVAAVPGMGLDAWALVGEQTTIWSPGA